jgi:16S rRNA (cytidine1402-2'-O)-methyltransferase
MGSDRGTLYIVSTPIGNLEDITLRALRILKEVGLIAAEDTRQTQKLLKHYGIHNPLTSYHDYNKEEKTEVLLQRLKEGISIALVCDAGTPLISDPGLYLIQRCIQEGIPMVPIPGASAVVCALSVAGLPTDAFLFEGFLPRKRGKRLKTLESLKTLPHTLIFFESPFRVVQTLKDCLEILGDRPMILARELTKVFEEVIRGRITEVLERVTLKGMKGEATILIEGARRKKGYFNPDDLVR